MTLFTSTKFFIIAAFLASFPFLVGASEIRLETSKAEMGVEEQFVVNIAVSADEPTNALLGRLVFSQDLLSMKEIRDGDSVINLWVEKPHVDKSGIFFSGVTPGGFTGVNNRIFSVVFEAKNTGTAFLNVEDVKALKNDGLGTEIPLLIHNTAISIRSGDSSASKETLVDTEPPEDFTPIITNNPLFFEGQNVLIFGTQDKMSGIEHYEVREGEWGRFVRAESPYLLKYQSLDRKIFVKAIDRAGNGRLAILRAREQTSGYGDYWILDILSIIVAVLFLLKKLWLRFTK